MKWLNVCLIFFIGCAGCSSFRRHPVEPETVVVRETLNDLERERVPATVTEPWVEPMYDTVRVPGQLDPEGTYYRPSHQTVVEIRPGRFQIVEFPEEVSEEREEW